MKGRTLAGLALMLASFAFIGGGTLILFKSVDVQSINERQAAETARQCTTKLNEIAKWANGAVTQQGVETVLTIKNFGDPRMALSAGDTAIMMCPNKDVSYQCMGDKCPEANNQIIYTLKLKDNKK